MNISATCSAIAALTSPFVAITPPNALTGSVACALRCASATSAPTAIPHGLVCLITATHRHVAMVVRGTPRGVRVDVVVVRHLLAVQLLRAGQAAPARGVERGGLVRVLAVAQGGRPFPGGPDPARERVAVAGATTLPSQEATATS